MNRSYDMQESISDLDLKLEWSRTGEDLRVTNKGKVLYSSVSGLVSPSLSPRQVRWITEDYERKRKQYAY